MANDLTVRMLGDVEISQAGISLLPKLSSKSMAIIALLICHDHRKLTREKIASMLWADSFETANYNLRYNLWNLKKVVPPYNGEDFILSTKEACSINAAYPFRSDVAELAHLDASIMGEMDVTSLNQVKQVLKGEFMDQFYIKDSEEFNDWILFERAKYQKLYVQCLNILLKKHTAQEQTEQVVDLLEEMLQINPYDEEIHYRLMEAHMKQGSRYLAILAYKKCNTLLREELNIIPQKRIKDLYLSIIDSQEETTCLPPSAHRKKAVTFTLNEYADKNLEYLAMSQLIEKMASGLDRVSLAAVPQKYWADLETIYPDAEDFFGGSQSCDKRQPGSESDSKHLHGSKSQSCDKNQRCSEIRPWGEIRDIRLFSSFRSILMHLESEFRLEISIQNSRELDMKSSQFFRFIEHTTDIPIQYVSEERRENP